MKRIKYILSLFIVLSMFITTAWARLQILECRPDGSSDNASIKDLLSSYNVKAQGGEYKIFLGYDVDDHKSMVSFD
ncbi:MAG TPA: hypothetical protein VKR58_03210, partial [Aquella sp.]|nr:hypothetical protein [Aquella sp.]